MKKLILLSSAALAAMIGAASAADLPSRRAPPVPYVAVPVFTWTGFYFGGNAGYLWSDTQVTTSGNQAITAANVAANLRPGSFKVEPDGFIGGGQFGYNMQIGSFVVGLETDIQYTDVARTHDFVSGAGPRSSYRTTMDYFGTVRGRLGYAWDRTLIYATGGFAYGEVYNRAFFSNVAGGAPLTFRGAVDDTETGYTVGGGIEWAVPNYTLFNQAVTVKAEYLYYDLGHRNITVAGVSPATVGTSYNARFHNDGHIVRAGLNFKFSSW